MGRKSTMEDKTVFQVRREELGLSRERASELLPGITAERLEKLERRVTPIGPGDALSMAEGYGEPALANHYCSRMCPIGRRYVPEVRARDLSNIALDMQLSLKAIDEGAYRLAEIAVDDAVAEMEREDFELIRSQLERIAGNVRELQLWAEKSLGAERQ